MTKQYPAILQSAAEAFLVGQFAAPTQFTEASHLPDLVDAAMCIVTGAAWVQPGEGPHGKSILVFDDDES